MTRANCSSVILRSIASSTMLALLTSTSMRPYLSVTPFTMAAMLALSVTLTVKPIAWPPWPAISATTWSTALRSRSQTTTLAPSAANFNAVAWPIPRAEPVIMATLSFNLIGLFSVLCLFFMRPGGPAALYPIALQCTTECITGLGSGFLNLHQGTGLDEIEQFQEVAVVHADAAYRAGPAHDR